MSKTIVRVSKRENPYVILDKTFLSDNRISWKAKGILAYLMSKPDDWKVIIGNLINQSTDGEKSVYSGLRELEKYGYMTRERVRDEKGKFIHMEYIVYELPIATTPDESSISSTSPFSACGKTARRKSSRRKGGTTNNRLLLNNDITKKDNNKDKDVGKNVVVDSLNLNDVDVQLKTKELISAYQEMSGTIDDIPVNIFSHIKSIEDIVRMENAMKYIQTNYINKKKKIKNLPGLLKKAFEENYQTKTLNHRRYVAKEEWRNDNDIDSEVDFELVEQQRNLFRKEAIKIFGKDAIDVISSISKSQRGDLNGKD